MKIDVVLLFSLALKRQTTEFNKCDNKFCIPGLPVHQLSFIITCAENMKENALLVFQNTAGYRTEYTTKAKA